MELPSEKMPEAEVSLRLAFALVESGQAVDNIDVAVDGAQVRTGDAVHFPISAFLSSYGWEHQGPSEQWQGTYRSRHHSVAISVHSSPGLGDVVAKLKNGKLLRVEAKKGTLERSKSSAEYKLLREALGQLITIESTDAADMLAVAVPSSEKSEQLAATWRSRPLIQKTGIHIVTVSRAGAVRGLEDAGI